MTMPIRTACFLRQVVAATAMFFVFTATAPSLAQTLNEVTEVEVFYPQRSENARTLHLTGSVEAYQRADLAAQQAGAVASFSVEAGDTVQQGDLLMTLDARLAELAVAESQASLKAAQIAEQEAKRLYNEVVALSKKQVVAQTLISERRAQHSASQSELTRRQANLALQQEVLARHTLRAPFAGVIAERRVDQGEWVTPQTSVFTLIEQQRLRLAVAIPQEYYAAVAGRRNIQVQIRPDTGANEEFSATLSRLVPVSNTRSRTFTAYIDVPPDEGLVTGMSARASVSLPEGDDPLVWLPRNAVKLHPDGGSSVFTVENGQARRIIVSVRDRRNDLLAVSNAPANQGYITTGVELLRDGAAVRITNSRGN